MKILFLSLLILTITSSLFAGDKAVIWISGTYDFAGGHNFPDREGAIEMDTARRAANIYKGLIKKGVSPDDIYIHVTTGNKAAIEKSTSTIRTMIDPIAYAKATVHKNITAYFKSEELPVKPENIKEGTLKSVTTTFDTIATQLKDNPKKTDSLFVYTTMGTDDGKPDSPMGIYESTDSDTGNYFTHKKIGVNETPEAAKKRKQVAYQEFVVPSISAYKEYEKMVEEAKTNPQLQKLLNTPPQKQQELTQGPFSEMIAYFGSLGLVEYLRKFGDQTTSFNIQELCKLAKINPEQRKKYIDNHIANLTKMSESGMKFFPSKETTIGPSEFSELFNRIPDGVKITFLNEVFSSLVAPGLESKICEYHTRIQSDEKSTFSSRIFGNNMKKSTFSELIKDVEAQRIKNPRQYGYYSGTTTLDRYLELLSARIQKENEIKSKAGSSDSANCSTCIPETTQVPDAWNQLRNQVSRDELKRKVGEFKQEKDLSKFNYLDNITEEETKNLEKLLDCFNSKL